MRLDRFLTVAAGLLILCLFPYLPFDTGKLHAEAAAGADMQASQEQEMCVLGEKVTVFPFYVYKDAESGENNFLPTGYMGDFAAIEIDPYCREIPCEGTSCTKIVYNASHDQAYGWAGLYWQYPPGNWGNMPEAYDLSAAAKLTFLARGKYGGEVINRFQVGGIAGKYRDSGVASIGPIFLSRKWKRYEIDLTKMNDSIIVSNEDKECWPFMSPLSRIVGGFCWATSLMSNHNTGITFYLDEIRFEKG